MRGFDIPREEMESGWEAEEDRLNNQEERFCIEQIERLKQEYVKACEPWAKRLEAIRRSQPQRFMITVEEARRLGLLTG